MQPGLTSNAKRFADAPSLNCFPRSDASARPSRRPSKRILKSNRRSLWYLSLFPAQRRVALLSFVVDARGVADHRDAGTTSLYRTVGRSRPLRRWISGWTERPILSAFDLVRLYGDESLKQAPWDAVNLRGLPDGRYFAPESAEAAILLSSANSRLQPTRAPQGTPPFSWPAGSMKVFAIQHEWRSAKTAVYETEIAKTIAACSVGIDRHLPQKGGSRRTVLRQVERGNKAFAMVAFTDLTIWRLAGSQLHQPAPWHVREIGLSNDAALLVPRPQAARDRLTRLEPARCADLRDRRSLFTSSPRNAYFSDAGREPIRWGSPPQVIRNGRSKQFI